MMTYVLLPRDERLRHGDERLCDDCESWEPVTGIFIGMAYSPAVMVPVRRCVSLDTAPALCV